jgi:hypothetical protein
MNTLFVEKKRCSFFDNCKNTHDKEHTAKYYHKCKYDSKGCNHISKEYHCHYFLHKCPKGDQCTDTEKSHQILFLHEKSIPENLQTLNFKSVDKSKLTKHSKSWEKASSIEVTLKMKEKFKFIGFESISPVDIDKNSIILFKETGKGVFNGYLKKVNISEIEIPNQFEFSQPWDNENVLVVKHDMISNKMTTVLNQKVNGLDDTFLDIIKFIHSNGIPVFIVGGCIRDLIRDIKTGANTEIKDIDLGFGCSANELESILKLKYQKVKVSKTGLVSIGEIVSGTLFLEGKSLNGFNNDRYSITSKNSEIPKCIGTDLFNENICRDFTCNSLWYDCINKTIIDPTGYGIQDVLNLKIRIPVSYWKFWLQGNPTKLMRYMKMKAKGYSAVDSKTEKFIIDNFTDGNSNRMMPYFQFKHCSSIEKPFVKSWIISLVGESFWKEHFEIHGF